MLPSAKRRISGRFGKCFSRSLQKDFLKAGKAETRRAAESGSPATRSLRGGVMGRMKSPDAVTDQKAGYKTEDTCQSKVLICILAAEVHCHRSDVCATKDSASTAQSTSTVASRQTRVRLLHHASG